MSFRETYRKKKYKAVFNPLGWVKEGQYTIKTDDEYETPIAVVFVGIGPNPKLAKKFAKEKADYIVELLNINK